ncbi:MAG: transposase [Nevskia sp.]|nr:transposase [Nevskia sp.]
MDRRHLQATLPALKPRDLTGLRYLGVDEVARAKGHDYVTVVYDLESGGLLWVGDGKCADSLGLFLAELSQDTAAGIEAVAMDMGPAYQAAVREHLPNATIVFDRFQCVQPKAGAFCGSQSHRGKSRSPVAEVAGPQLGNRGAGAYRQRPRRRVASHQAVTQVNERWPRKS